MCSASRQRCAYGLLDYPVRHTRDVLESLIAMAESAYLNPRFELPNDALLMGAHEPHFCGRVHDEVPAVRYIDAATRFLAGALL
jgi:hypothetical protein